MPGKFSLVGKSTKSKTPWTSSPKPKPRKSSGPGPAPASSSTTSPPSRPGPLRPDSGPAASRSRSQEPDRRMRRSDDRADGGYPRPSRPPRKRSVSPRARPPLREPGPGLRRRPRRDSSLSDDEYSRPATRRTSLSPRRPRAASRPPRSGVPPAAWSGPTRRPSAAGRRPSFTGYPPEPYSGDGRRRSYDMRPQRPPPAGYRSSVHGIPMSHEAPRRPEDVRRASVQGPRVSSPRVSSPRMSPRMASPRMSSPRPSREQLPRPPVGRYASPRASSHASPSGASSKPASHAPTPSKSPEGTQFFDLLQKIPQALITYTGLKELTQHADTAREWATWLNDLHDAPKEISDLSDKVTAARDTITQIKNTIAARPDLLEGDSGKFLRQQIETAIGSADTALAELTELLRDLSDDGDKDALRKLYGSYKYKNIWSDKIKESEAILDKELATLTTLMVNIYSRAISKPPPKPPAEDPAKERKSEPRPEPKEARSEHRSETSSRRTETPTIREPNTKSTMEDTKPEHTTPEQTEPSEQKSDTKPTPEQTKPDAKLSVPDPDTNAPEADLSRSRPPSPAAVAREEANIGIPPSEKESTEKAHSRSRSRSRSLASKADLEALREPSPAPRKQQAPPQQEQQQPPKQDQQPPKQDQQQPTPEKSPEDILLDAAWSGDLDATNQALHKASPGTRDARGLTPLHLAAERDHLAIAMLLLDRGADPDARDDKGRTPLHLAGRYATAATVEVLLEDGRADANARTNDGRTPLHYAAGAAADGDEERREAVRVLRDWGADPTAEDSRGRTARAWAQKRDHWDVSSTLRRAEKKWEEQHRQGWLRRHGFIH